MVLFLGHSDQVIRGRTGQTREPDAQSTRQTDLYDGGSGESYRSVWSIAKAGIPLFAASSASRFTIACARGQVCLHGETPQKLDRRGSQASPQAALLHWSVGGGGTTRKARSRQRPWLNPNASPNCNAKFIFYRIVMYRKRCPRFIAGLCRKPNRPTPSKPHN